MSATQLQIAAMIEESIATAHSKPWNWSKERIAATLMERNAMRAVRGKKSPVAGKVLENLLSE